MLLDTKTVHALLKQYDCQTPFHLHFHDSLDSTNNWIKTLPITNDIPVCCAEKQTQGRGRFGRVWHSPEAENIYCSLRWPFEKEMQQLSGLGLVIAFSLMKTLKQLGYGKNMGIKWPNDILWNGQKLAGILIELLITPSKTIQAIIGIGLNVNSDTKNNPLTDREWISLWAIHGQKMDRNQILAVLLSELSKQIPRFIEQRLTPFLPEIAQWDLLKGKSITVFQNTHYFQGKACGIASDGTLMLEDETGNIHAIASGDASLKMPDNL